LVYVYLLRLPAKTHLHCDWNHSGWGGSDSCPVFVAYVWEASPAERAGIKSGDVLIAVDGTRISTGDEAFKLLQSEKPTPVTLTPVRQEKPYVATVGREQRSTLPCNQRDKLLKSGFLVPRDATEAEINAKLASITQDRLFDRVFPTHYPSNEKLDYAEFEVLILKNPLR
jgi:membrane-associated protease RseP (regulator of RpoE activity)